MSGVLVACLALCPLGAGAQQTPPTFSLSVTEPYELVEEVGTSRRITRAEIDARNARTLDEALKLLPGLYVRTGGDGIPRIDMRGFRSRHVLLLINGVQVNSTADGQFDPARISTDSIREIKVSYGTSSILYGDNAMAGVIEITTVDDTPDATLHVHGGAPEQFGGGGRYARTLGKWSAMASADGFTRDGYELPGSFEATSVEDGDRRQNSDRDRGDFRGAVGYRASGAVSVASEWHVGTGSYGVAPSTITDTADSFAQAPRFERVNGYRVVSGQGSVVVAPSPRFNVRAWGFRNAQREDRARYDDATYSSMDDPLVQGTFRSRENTTVTGVSALARMNLQRAGWLRVAVNQRREAFDATGAIRDVASGGSGGSGGAGGGRGGGAPRPTTYEERAFSIDHHVDVHSTGGEWQFQPLARFGTVLGAAVNVQRRPDGQTETDPTWLAGVSYDATDTLRLRASASRKIRVPSIDQLFNTAAGNPELRSEHANGVDVGAEYKLGAVSTVTVSLFSTHARDFIERHPGEPFANQDRYRFRGSEVTVQTTRIPQLDLRGTYSFLDADSITPEGTRTLQTRPRHRGSFEGLWTPASRSTVRGAVYQAGSQFFDARGSSTAQWEEGAYTLVDVGFRQQVMRRMEVALDVTNLFDRLYQQSYGLPREGRAVVLTLRARAR